MPSYIYKILNVATDDFYVGSTTREPKKRRWEHWDALKRGAHHCTALQAAWDEFGADAFEFSVTEEVPDGQDVALVEDMHLLVHAGHAHCYNTAMSTQYAASHLPEIKAKIAEALKRKFINKTLHPRYGKKHSEETKAKIAAARKGQQAGENHYRYGTTLSEEVRKKIGDAQRGKPKAPRVLTEEGRAKIRAAAEAGHYATWTGKSHTEESKLKMSKAVVATDPNGVEHEYPSITALRKATGFDASSINNCLKSGLPISKGARKGWSFRYK